VSSRLSGVPRFPRSSALFLALVASAATLAVAEGLLRAIEPRAEGPEAFAFVDPAGSPFDAFVSHDTRFLALRPGFRFAPEHAGPYALGRWPFRGPPPAPAPPEVLHVLVLGDSCVFGLKLDASDTLPHRLQLALAERGLDPTRVLVHNLGVPGYSTVQVRATLEETLATLAADLVVLHLAAWNDQAPALGANDLEIRARLPGPCARWLRSLALARLFARDPGGRAAPSADADATLRAWSEGRAPHGERVPETSLPAELEALLDLCATQGLPVVVAAPAHPAATAQAHPRTRRDATAAAAAGRAHGAAVVDDVDALRAAGLADGQAFLDFVHLAPSATRALAAALAEAAAPLLERRAAQRATPPRLEILGVEPARVPALGDARVRIRLGAAPRDPQGVAATLGGAPLLDLDWVEPDILEGTLVANAAGPQDLIVQTSRGCAWRAAAIELLAPELRLSVAAPEVLELVSRPGDRFGLYACARVADALAANAHVRFVPDADAELCADELVCDERGVARLALADLPVDLAGKIWLRASVVPRGLGALWPARRWTAPLELDRDAPR
jgi:hypothetical protein